MAQGLSLTHLICKKTAENRCLNIKASFFRSVLSTHLGFYCTLSVVSKHFSSLLPTFSGKGSALFKNTRTKTQPSKELRFESLTTLPFCGLPFGIREGSRRGSASASGSCSRLLPEHLCATERQLCHSWSMTERPTRAACVLTRQTVSVESLC